MICNLRQTLWIVMVLFCLSSSGQLAAQTQNPRPISAEPKQGDITHRVQVQFLVASNIATKTRTDYPASLEPIVRQIKSLLQFKNHYLVATYLYHAADSGGFEVRDVTYASFENGSGLHPMFFDIGVSGIKLNPNDSIHIPRFKFEARQRIALAGGATPLFDTVTTGITTELNLKYGVPNIVGTLTNALSDGVLVLVVTVNRLEVR